MRTQQEDPICEPGRGFPLDNKSADALTLELPASRAVQSSSLMALEVKNLHANAGDLKHEFDPWVKEILWKRAEDPGRLQSMGLQGVRHN